MREGRAAISAAIFRSDDMDEGMEMEMEMGTETETEMQVLIVISLKGQGLERNVAIMQLEESVVGRRPLRLSPNWW